MRRSEAIEIPPSPNLEFEQEAWNTGLAYVAGIDEAGRGPLAGPVASAAVILPPDPDIIGKLNGVNDSKLLTAAQRETWAEIIKKEAISWAVGFASPEEIDRFNILQATYLAAWRAVELLSVPPDHLLLDYLELPGWPNTQVSLVKGDSRSLSIAAASILAKTTRDALLYEYDQQYPGYGFAKNKGYGTPEHLRALKELGPCPIHRFSFAPIKR
jgi:ribonuclease HII